MWHLKTAIVKERLNKRMKRSKMLLDLGNLVAEQVDKQAGHLSPREIDACKIVGYNWDGDEIMTKLFRQLKAWLFDQSRDRPKRPLTDEQIEYIYAYMKWVSYKADNALNLNYFNDDKTEWGALRKTLAVASDPSLN